jgi:hypothetical protein
MPRIKLANWYGDKAPGEELDVDDVMLKALRRDGMVAEVVEEQPAQVAGQQPEPTAETAAPEAEAAQQGRRKR